jgi:hypothetical protein
MAETLAAWLRHQRETRGWTRREYRTPLAQLKVLFGPVDVAVLTPTNLCHGLRLLRVLPEVFYVERACLVPVA